jgi:rhodanese-related sulfurtransferase
VAQIIFLSIVGLVLALYIFKFLRTRRVQQYSPGEITKKIDSRDRVLLLDVRTEGERRFQHIKGSLHIPLHQLRGRAEELGHYRDKEIVCYCQSGSRSLSAALILQRRGFRAASLRGGIVDWNFHGRAR